MGTAVIQTPNGTYKKVATKRTTSTQDKTPKSLTVDEGLTVFLGGAGMVGAYNDDMVAALTEAGITNPAYGNYSSLIEGLDQYLHPFMDMLGDASAVVLYNQDELDNVVFQYGEPAECTYGEEYIEKKYLFGQITIRQYNEVECHPPSELILMKISRDISQIKLTDFSLSNIGITRPIPQAGQFNFIGYSWGGVIAARTAIFHARKGTVIDHLVLIGAPVNKSLLDAVSRHPNILRTHIIDLASQGDPIYAGMTDKEIVDSSVKLVKQMEHAEGHFYYSGNDNNSNDRRRQLAKTLYQEGLR